MWMMNKGNGKGGGGGGIRDFDGKLRVWIGNLPQNPQQQKDTALNKQLKDHLSSTGLNCVYAHVGRNGGGQAAFKTEWEASQAIDALNGSSFAGNIIQVDALTTGNGGGSSRGGKKGSGKGGGGRNWGGRGVWNPMDMMKVMSAMWGGKGGGKGGKGGGKGGGGGGIRDFDGSVRVWIGNLPQNSEHKKDIALNKKLKEHMSSSGLNCVFAHVGRNGGGQAAFKSETEAQQAIATLNGTFFEGNRIQVDNLTKGGR